MIYQVIERISGVTLSKRIALGSPIFWPKIELFCYLQFHKLHQIQVVNITFVCHFQMHSVVCKKKTTPRTLLHARKPHQTNPHFDNPTHAQLCTYAYRCHVHYGLSYFLWLVKTLYSLIVKTKHWSMLFQKSQMASSLQNKFKVIERTIK